MKKSKGVNQYGFRPKKSKYKKGHATVTGPGLIGGPNSGYINLKDLSGGKKTSVTKGMAHSRNMTKGMNRRSPRTKGF